MRPELSRELASVLNRHNVDTEHGTPDYVLADFLVANLDALLIATDERADWHGQPRNPLVHRLSRTGE